MHGVQIYYSLVNWLTLVYTGLSLVTQEDDLSMFLLLWDFKPIMYTLWSRNTFVYWGHNSAVDEVNGVHTDNCASWILPQNFLVNYI